MSTTPALSSPIVVPDFEVMLWSGPSIDLIWPEVEPLFMKGERFFGDYFTVESFRILISGGRFVLWTASDDYGIFMIMVVEIATYPVARIARILYLGGSGLDRILPIIDMLYVWARQHNAERIEFEGRPGIIRLLEKYGYRWRSVCMAYDLQEIVVN